MAKVLLINPVVREEDVPMHIPYGIALLASVAIENGHQVQIFDANAWRKGFDFIEKACLADDWDVIGIGGLTTTYNFVKKACKIITRAAPNATLLAGGGFFTSMPREVMSWIPEIDLGLVGEAFTSFPEVLNRIDEKNDDWGSVLGICYREKTGKIKMTGTRPNIPDMDVLPYPAWDLLPMDIYFENSASLYSEENYTAKRRIDINGSLGCSLICRYCWHLGTTGDMVIEENPEIGENDVRFTRGRNIRWHSPRYIVNMVKHLVEKYNIDFCSYIDENMMTMDVASRRTWLKELSALWIEEGLQPTCRRDKVPHDHNCRGVHWSGTSHAALHRPDTLEVMYEAGCSHLVYGIESFNRTILKNLGKGASVKHNKEAVRVCMESGIKPIPNIIIGFPEESFESVRDTINALLELGIHAKPHFATAYPGSEWYYRYKDSILEQYDGDLERYVMDLGDATKITAVLSHKFSAMELLGLQQIVALRDLRLLDQAERCWNDSDEARLSVAVPKESFNFLNEKTKAPIDKPEDVRYLSGPDGTPLQSANA